MRGLKFFSKTNSRGHWNVASWHSPHSLTWRWILSFSLFRADEGRVWPMFWHGKGSWTLRIPFIGFLQWSTQEPMWYRDMYVRLRNERDRLDQWPSYSQMAQVPEPKPPAPKPVVVGGTDAIN